MSNVEKMIALRAQLAIALNVLNVTETDNVKIDDILYKLLNEADSEEAVKNIENAQKLTIEIFNLSKGFADSESFVPKGWREAVGRSEPLPLSKVAELSPIDDATIAKIPLAMQTEIVHDTFAKNVTVKLFLERLKGKTFFTLGELAHACGFDNKERNLNQIVGNAGFRSVIGSFALKGRIVKAKKGPGQGSTSNDNVKAVAATLDL